LMPLKQFHRIIIKHSQMIFDERFYAGTDLEHLELLP
jgi:hypothetical protein